MRITIAIVSILFCFAPASTFAQPDDGLAVGKAEEEIVPDTHGR